MSTFPPRADVMSMGTRSTTTGRFGETPSSPPHERADTIPASRRILEGALTRSTIGATGPASSEWSSELRESRLVHRGAPDDRANDPNVLDLVVGHRVRIVRQDDEVRQLAGSNRPLD